ncbi:uncharacterized protein PHALS_07582 [Plasmopara halstedii]|uniref:Uncharacterized protein n=1 Tax=Plasmopara halstedii TaxID=4781 RepID=A0A0P1B4V2_PLAHL|nr:uncharacterized protein PHALS_07582 [Plasmopara halstedii]CEG49841.1 hypothetical protein PHALS_07582 [Plasmopara halstedii]|eukprot:XP_024586210.1 hypothetical protein PHALS_07582 [Plasmopara halstedii]
MSVELWLALRPSAFPLLICKIWASNSVQRIAFMYESVRVQKVSLSEVLDLSQAEEEVSDMSDDVIHHGSRMLIRWQYQTLAACVLFNITFKSSEESSSRASRTTGDFAGERRIPGGTG